MTSSRLICLIIVEMLLLTGCGMVPVGESRRPGPFETRSVEWNENTNAWIIHSLDQIEFAAPRELTVSNVNTRAKVPICELAVFESRGSSGWIPVSGITIRVIRTKAESSDSEFDTWLAYVEKYGARSRLLPGHGKAAEYVFPAMRVSTNAAPTSVSSVMGSGIGRLIELEKGKIVKIDIRKYHEPVPAESWSAFGMFTDSEKRLFYAVAESIKGM